MTVTGARVCEGGEAHPEVQGGQAGVTGLSSLWAFVLRIWAVSKGNPASQHLQAHQSLTASISQSDHGLPIPRSLDNS